MTTEIETPAETLPQAIEAMGITMTAVFVPWSASRNKGEKEINYSTQKPTDRPRRSLNWRVTIHYQGRDVLTTDYGAGTGHCPADKAIWSVPGHSPQALKAEAIALETEKGMEATLMGGAVRASRKPILPNLADVIHSMASDSDVIDHPTFESWASDFGYDTDSRKGEAVYRACLELALKMRAGFGDAGLERLRAAAHDY